MSSFEGILETIAGSEIRDKVQLADYLLNILGKIKNLHPEDRKELAEFADEQVDQLLDRLPHIGGCKEKDMYCAYGMAMAAIYSAVFKNKDDMPPDSVENARELVRMIREAQPIETAAEKIFSQDTVEEAYIDRLLSFARSSSDEYERGKVFHCLLDSKDRLSGITGGAKKRLTSYFEEELERYLRMEHPDKDALVSWEEAADAARYFPSEKIRQLLTETLESGHHGIEYYAAETLLDLGAEVPQECISALAADLEYAVMTRDMLNRYGKLSVFPQEYSAPEYLAKSDMVHWLVYPTELGKAPDEIEFVGTVRYVFRREEYYIFRFRSDSANLGDDVRGKWLLGWSAADGGTFSRFEPFEKYEKGSVKKTLANIKRHIIG